MYFATDAQGRIKSISTTHLTIPLLETVFIDVDSTHEIFQNIVGWRVVDGELVKDVDAELAHAKEAKLEELRRACQATIEAGFMYEFNEVEYWFSLDQEAQQNFTSSYQVMRDDIIAEIPWTVRVDGQYSRLVITKSMMEELAMAIMIHKTNNISKLRDILSPIVMGAETVEDVNAISW